MTICITSKGASLDAPCEERFGRAPYYIIIGEKDRWEAVENPLTQASGGVGPRSVQLLVNHGVSILITGRMGGNALQAIRAAGIEVYAFEGGTVKDALEAYRRGALSRIA